MDRPVLGDFPRDTNPPGGPLAFYVAFDGTSDNAEMNAVDSIRAAFPANNPLTSIDGVQGKAIQGESRKFITYARPNNWASVSESFTISVWYKKDGTTKNNTGGNGAEYIFSFKSNNGHWSGASFFLFLEGTNEKGMVKMMAVDRNMADNWFTWEGDHTIPGLLDGQWHHLAIVYDAATSVATLYIDGEKNPQTRAWGNHGPINLNNNAITEMRLGAGPSDNINSDDWLAGSFKGALDQFRLYSTALTEAEVQQLYSNRM